MEHEADRQPPSPDKGRLKEPLLLRDQRGRWLSPSIPAGCLLPDGLAAGVLVLCMEHFVHGRSIHHHHRTLLHPTEAKKKLRVDDEVRRSSGICSTTPYFLLLL